MRVQGTFDTAADAAELRSLTSSPDTLATVPTFTELRLRDDGTIVVQFSPLISLGQITLDTVISPGVVDAHSATVRVVARRGNQLVSVDLVIRFDDSSAGSHVQWEADVLLGGTVASVGQRVGAEVARRAIGEVLEAAAAAAAAVGVPA